MFSFYKVLALKEWQATMTFCISDWLHWLFYVLRKEYGVVTVKLALIKLKINCRVLIGKLWKYFTNRCEREQTTIKITEKILRKQIKLTKARSYKYLSIGLGEKFLALWFFKTLFLILIFLCRNQRTMFLRPLSHN